MIPAPPDWLSGDYELKAWATGYASAAVHGGWSPIFASMLGVLASCAGQYCRATIAQRATESTATAAGLAELAELRLLVRAMMADWFLLPAQRAPLGAVRADGLDVDIAALCGVTTDSPG
jgi:hypothetical protein